MLSYSLPLQTYLCLHLYWPDYQYQVQETKTSLYIIYI